MESCLEEMEWDRRREAVQEQDEVKVKEVEELAEWEEADPAQDPGGTASAVAVAPSLPMR